MTLAELVNVMVAATGAHETVLSVLVDARFGRRLAVSATSLGTDGMAVPEVVMPVTATLYVVPLPVTVAVFVPPAVPLIVTSPVTKPVTAALKTTVKLIGEVPVGSA